MLAISITGAERSRRCDTEFQQLSASGMADDDIARAMFANGCGEIWRDYPPYVADYRKAGPRGGPIALWIPIAFIVLPTLGAVGVSRMSGRRLTIGENGIDTGRRKLAWNEVTAVSWGKVDVPGVAGLVALAARDNWMLTLSSPNGDVILSGPDLGSIKEADRARTALKVAIRRFRPDLASNA